MKLQQRPLSVVPNGDADLGPNRGGARSRIGVRRGDATLTQVARPSQAASTQAVFAVVRVLCACVALTISACTDLKSSRHAPTDGGLLESDGAPSDAAQDINPVTGRASLEAGARPGSDAGIASTGPQSFGDGTGVQPQGGSSAPLCDVVSCPEGCCAGSTCVAYADQTSTQCGGGGAPCNACPDGQGCGTTGACGCGPESCPNGCCSEGGCIPFTAQSTEQCGAAGSVCSACQGGQTCSPSGACTCDSTSCPDGCCSADNQCILSAEQSNAMCGSSGNACAECGAGEACDHGACSCGGAACEGCCQNGACVTPSDSACGVSGGQCAACPQGQHCDATGKCVCDATSCPSGCCDSDGRCQAATVAACGSGGETCLSCSFSRAEAGCSDGKCSVASCESGFADCNGDPTDGCEVNTLTNASHCHQCNAACSLANAGSSCENGQCTITQCSTGFADCDLNPANGCETDVRTSASHCGQCDKSCPAPSGGQAVCEAGKCGSRCTGSSTICGSACISNTACCTDADCDLANHEVCPGPGERCKCAGTYKECNGECISNKACCPATDTGEPCTVSGVSGFCNSDGTCVECVQEADCEPKGLHCLTTSGKCVDCLLPKHCSHIQFGTCNTSHKCVVGAGCGNHAIDSGEQCDPGAGRWDSESCNSSDCTSNIYMGLSSSACFTIGNLYNNCTVSCTRDSDCPALPAPYSKAKCATGAAAGNTCVLPCSTNTDCLPGSGLTCAQTDDGKLCVQ